MSSLSLESATSLPRRRIYSSESHTSPTSLWRSNIKKPHTPTRITGLKKAKYTNSMPRKILSLRHSLEHSQQTDCRFWLRAVSSRITLTALFHTLSAYWVLSKYHTQSKNYPRWTGRHSCSFSEILSILTCRLDMALPWMNIELNTDVYTPLQAGMNPLMNVPLICPGSIPWTTMKLQMTGTRVTWHILTQKPQTLSICTMSA